MVMYKARIKREASQTSLELIIRRRKHIIILTEDKQNDLKNVFNTLIKELKKNEFNFEIDDTDEDLYSHISREYIKQLNSELSSVYKELADYKLLE